MTKRVHDFLERLSKSGLVSAEDAKLAGNELQNDAVATKQVLTALVKKRKLTRFQAESLLRGEGHRLVLGNYIIHDRLGEGGMGVVYKAWHKPMERYVALKVLSDDFTKNPRGVERFRREVKALAKLSHPNIVVAFDAGEHRGRHFLAMEYVTGKNLATIVKESGPLPIPVGVHCTLEAARGLAYAHAQGVIHRDVKPANMVPSKNWQVKLLDMGLVRFVHLLRTGNAPSSHSGITQHNDQILGTIDYMAPEQAVDAAQADHRSDIYSLGCSLYYLLTGKVPYAEDTAIKRILAHRDTDIPAIRSERPEIPKELHSIFVKMVAKKPGERYQKTTEVIRDLEACHANLTQPTGETSAGGPDKTYDLAKLTPERRRSSGEVLARWERRAMWKSPVFWLVLAALLAGGYLYRQYFQEAAAGPAVAQATAEPELPDEGKVRIRLSNNLGPFRVTIDGKVFTLPQLDEPLTLLPGEHRLQIQGKNITPVDHRFTVRRGDDLNFQIALTPKQTNRSRIPR